MPLSLEYRELLILVGSTPYTFAMADTELEIMTLMDRPLTQKMIYWKDGCISW